MDSLEYNIEELNNRYQQALGLIDEAKTHEFQGELQKAEDAYLGAASIIKTARRLKDGVEYHRDRISPDSTDFPRLQELGIDDVLGLDFEGLIPQIRDGIDGNAGKLLDADEQRREPYRTATEEYTDSVEKMLEKEFGILPYARPIPIEETIKMIGKATNYVSLPEATRRSRRRLR